MIASQGHIHIILHRVQSHTCYFDLSESNTSKQFHWCKVTNTKIHIAMEIGGDSKQSSDIVQGTSIQEDNIKQVLCDITNIVKEDVKQSVSNSDEVKSLGDR